MLKRLLSLVLCVALFTFVCGCSRPEDVLADGISVTDNEDTRTVTLDAYNVTIDFPKEWYVDMNDAEVDLFCSNGPEYMGLYGFSADEIAASTLSSTSPTSINSAIASDSSETTYAQYLPHATFCGAFTTHSKLPSSASSKPKYMHLGSSVV